MSYTMHRTQLLLAEGQYQTLKSLADAQGRSLSDLVREVVASYLEGQPARAARRLAEITGVAEGPPDMASNHDHYLYGLPKRAPGANAASTSKAKSSATRSPSRKTSSRTSGRGPGRATGNARAKSPA